MSKVFYIIVLMCAVLPNSMAIAKEVNQSSHGATMKAIYMQAQNKFHSVPNIISNLKISSPQDKIELIVMANEFTNKIESIIYNLNQAVPNIKNEESKRIMEAGALKITDLVHQIQRCIHDDSLKLQKELAVGVENYVGHVEKGLEMFIQYNLDSEIFIAKQARVAAEIAIWAINKLHFQAVLFTKTNKELKKEFDSGLAIFRSGFDKIVTNDENTKDSLVHLVQLSNLLTHSAIIKLENWLAINLKDTGSYKIVDEAAETLSRLYDKQHTFITSNMTATEIVTQYKEVFRTGSGKVTKMTDAVLRENLGGQEYVRSALLDCLTAANSFGERVDLLVAKN